MTVATVHVFGTGEGCLNIAGEAKSPVIVFLGEEINWNIVMYRVGVQDCYR